MLIGELAEKTNLSRHTIRYYEKLGLIDMPGQSRRDNNYKEYPEEVLRQLVAIQKIKAQGFTLKEAKGIIHLISTGTLDRERGTRYVLHKVKRIEKQIQQLEEIRRTLLSIAGQTEWNDCEVERILKGKKFDG